MDVLAHLITLSVSGAVGGFFGWLFGWVIKIAFIVGVIALLIWWGTRSREPTPPPPLTPQERVERDIGSLESRIAILEERLGEPSGWGSIAQQVRDLEARVSDLEPPAGP